MVGAVTLKVQRQLSGFSPGQLLTAPPATGLQSLHPCLQPAIDEEYDVTLCVEIGLKQQRAVGDKGFDILPLRQNANQLGTAASNPRVDHHLQATKIAAAGKNTLAHPAAVDLAVRQEDLMAPHRSDGGFDLSGSEGLVGQIVRIDPGGTQIRQDLGYQTLAGPNPAYQSNYRLMGYHLANPDVI